MKLLNSESTYGLLAIVLHWLIVEDIFLELSVVFPVKIGQFQNGRKIIFIQYQ